MTETGLPPIDYTSRDFAGFRESLLAFAAERMPEWRGAKTGDANDFGVLFAEMLAYEGDVLSYYTDRVANEAFLQTAVQRQSVLNHAALLNYTPQSATAAVVPVVFSVTTGNAPVTIPAGFQVATRPPAEGGPTLGSGSAPSVGDGEQQPVVFETTVPVTLPASTTRDPVTGDIVPVRQQVVIVCEQGETIPDEVVATLCGEVNGEYRLAQAPVIVDSVVVRVVEGPNDPGTVWFRVGNMLDAGPNDNAYTLTLDENDAVTITMGDGVNGRIAPRGSVLHARYRVGGGEVGNVPDGDVTEVPNPDDVIIDVPGSEPGGGGASNDPTPGDGDQDNDGLPDASDPDFVPPGDVPDLAPPEIEVVNLEPARGGTNSESLESIRANAPRARRTNGRAVSLEDYETLALTVPGVQIAKAKAVARVYTNVTLYVAPPGGTQPDQRTLNAVVDYMLPRKMAGVTVVAATPTYVPIDVTLHVIVDSRFNQNTVKTAVGNALQTVLDFEKVGFGERVALSSIYAAAIGVQGVINVVITRLARQGAPAGAADVLLAENELPTVGTASLTAEGGVVNSGDPAGAGVSPTASSAPSIQLLRCDPASTHIELTWVPGSNTTFWEVEVRFLAADGTVASTTTAGPFSFPEAIFDLPRIGPGRAKTMWFRTRAYNGNTGPVDSPVTTTPYTCE